MLSKINKNEIFVETDCRQLIEIFNQLFLSSENTELRMGAKEPFFQSSKGLEPAVIFFTEDYFSSALHEIAHWCIAGKERRQKDDYGYWYQPDGRNQSQQMAFERLEVKPQAIEWMFSLACNHQFHFSADNLSEDITHSAEFEESVKIQVKEYFNHYLPNRAELFIQALIESYRKGLAIELTEKLWGKHV